MATGNFYEAGNHGLHIIGCDSDGEGFEVEDTIANITCELEAKGWSFDELSRAEISVPRSFETGREWEVNDKAGKLVARISLAAGYYEHANLNIFTGDALLDELGEDKQYWNMTTNKRSIKTLLDVIAMYTTAIKRVATFSNGETIYEKN